jgi:hypothetical protein
MAVRLAVAGAFHTDYMAPAVERLQAALADTVIRWVHRAHSQPQDFRGVGTHTFHQNNRSHFCTSRNCTPGLPSWGFWNCGSCSLRRGWLRLHICNGVPQQLHGSSVHFHTRSGRTQLSCAIHRTLETGRLASLSSPTWMLHHTRTPPSSRPSWPSRCSFRHAMPIGRSSCGHAIG